MGAVDEIAELQAALDIVTRLRTVAWLAVEGSEVTDLADAAADEIERLRVENLRLEQANSAMKDAVHQLRWDNRRLADLYEGIARHG